MITTRQFLTAVWPPVGPYCIARPFLPPGATKPVYAQRAFEDIDDVITFVMAQRNSTDLFFAVHTLKVARSLNPETGKMKTYRTHENMKEARAFFFDLDVGEEAGKYPDQASALEGLQRFLFEVPLPDPIVTSSGNGLHVYFVIEDALHSEEWCGWADKLHWIARRFGLRADPSRTTDRSSVLRVVNTYNFKQPTAKKQVTTLNAGEVVATTQFTTLLDRLVGDDYTPVGYLAPSVTGPQDFQWDGRVTPADEIAEACEYVREFRDRQGQVPEPYWHVMIGTLKYADEGQEVCHDWSSGHPTYSQAETQQKIDLWKTAPPTCDKIKSACGGDACSRCLVQPLGKNPIAIANKLWSQRAAPAPMLLANAQAATGKIDTLVEPPYPYERRAIGIIRKLQDTDDADPTKKKRFVRICDYNMFPLQQFNGIGTEHLGGFSRWAVTLPLVGQTVIEIATSNMDARNLHAALMNQGVIIDGAMTNEMRNFMLAYLKTLQKASTALKQYDYMGWEVTRNEDDRSPAFILHGKKIDVGSGAISSCAMSKSMGGVGEFMKKAGSLDVQIDLLKFYDHPNYIPHQFVILCSMATPWFKYTNQHGVVINLSGDTGVSKSFGLYFAAAIWGHPTKYPISGIPGSSSKNGREDRAMMLANLPFMVDEITLMSPEEARETVMGATQPGLGPKMNKDRSIKDTRAGAKSNMMITTANASLHQLINTSNVAGQAGTVRVFEMHLRKGVLVHQKWEADAVMRELSHNYGWIGEALLTELLPHIEMIEKRIAKEMARLDALCNVEPHERFWLAPCAVAMVIGRIAYKLGFHTFDMQLIEDWIVNVQLPFLRGKVTHELQRRDPASVVMDYLEQIHGNTVRVEQDSAGVVSGILRVPDADLRAHFDITNQEIWVRIDPFRKHCEREGHPYEVIMRDLVDKRIITNDHIRKTLGDRTQYAKGRVFCFVVNLRHPEIASAAPVLTQDSIDPTMGNVVPMRKPKA